MKPELVLLLAFPVFTTEFIKAMPSSVSSHKHPSHKHPSHKQPAHIKDDFYAQEVRKSASVRKNKIAHPYAFSNQLFLKFPLYISAICFYFYATSLNVKPNPLSAFFSDVFLAFSSLMILILILSLFSIKACSLYNLLLPVFVTNLLAQFWFLFFSTFWAFFSSFFSNASFFSSIPEDQLISKIAQTPLLKSLNALFSHKTMAIYVSSIASFISNPIFRISLFITLFIAITLFIYKLFFFKSPLIRKKRLQVASIILVVAFHVYVIGTAIINRITSSDSLIWKFFISIVGVLFKVFRTLLSYCFSESAMEFMDSGVIYAPYIGLLFMGVLFFGAIYASILFLNSEKNSLKEEAKIEGRRLGNKWISY